MNKVFKITFAVLVAGMLNANSSMAAFPIKQQTVKTELAGSAINIGAVENGQLASEVTQSQKAEVNKMLHKKGGSSTIPQVLYVVLAIFWLGWLAMGINDNWNGYDWLISLVLYFLFWLPGFIYTLIKMNKYY